MCELLVGLPAVNVLGIDDVAGEALRVHIESRARRPFCEVCGIASVVKDRPRVELVDLAVFGRATRLVWHKHRWACPDANCPQGSWTGEDERIGYRRLAMSDRAGRWVTEQVGRYARSVNEVAHELGCDWHTVNGAVMAYGGALVDDDPARYGTVTALGLDEVLFAHLGPFRRLEFSTQFVDVTSGQLLDVIPGRSSSTPRAWLGQQGQDFCDAVVYATLDLSGPYRFALSAALPKAIQVADPFHVTKLANTKLDECRRRVQNATLGHRGRTDDPLYRCRRLLTKADERLDDHGKEKLLGLLRAGDPDGEVTAAWQAKEAIRVIYTHSDQALALQYLERLAKDMTHHDNPVEVRSLGRTLVRWTSQIVAWHGAHVSNGPTEAANNLIKRVKRAAFGFASFPNYRIRSLLYAGRPNWDLLATIRPR
ncbi:MAG TPA: ISL3 family transposase [Acidimicrobiales bacterium]|nr:ISL3 family transposase [Acidimicrobiales bacterium]